MNSLAGFGLDSCWIWIIIIFVLLCCCGDKGLGNLFGGFGNHCGNGCHDGGSDWTMWIIIIIIFFCCFQNNSSFC